MKIRVYRGQNQIGGNIVEISTDNTKILLDMGTELNQKVEESPEIANLFTNGNYDAVFVSHYHLDHMGLAYGIGSKIPLYIGEGSYKIVRAADNYKALKTISPAGFLVHKVPVYVGDIKVTPFLCDHSAYDSYMLLVESDGENALYTGDFRSSGRKSFDRLLMDLPVNINTLICEGTTLSRGDIIPQTETDLENKAVELFKHTEEPIFVLMSSMNIDSIVTVYRAAVKCKRLMLQDLYMAEITSAIGGNIPNPQFFPKVRAFITRGYDNNDPRYDLFKKYGMKRISKAGIIQSDFVMCVRSSMLNYLTSLSRKMSFKGGLLVYSLWTGYKDQTEMKEFILGCTNLGLEIVDLHTSGHADAETVRALVKHVNPAKILPIHTENAAWFRREYGNRIPSYYE
jgi:ribonuclease J